MELNIISQSYHPAVVFVSNQWYSDTQLLDMINPKEILAKAAYDYYWRKKSEQDINKYVMNYVRLRSKSLLECIGKCESQNSSVQMNNLVRVPEWCYIFQVRYDNNNKASLYIASIPVMGIFARNDSYLISVYNINWFDTGPVNVTTSHEEASQILNIGYYDPGHPISEYLVDWKPGTPQESKEPWLFFGLLLIFLIVILVVVVGSFFVMFHISKKVVNESTNIIKQYVKQEEKRSEYL